jgi:prolyl-tRNA synthetase
MRWSRLFIPTLRENPAEAGAVSHQLLLRAGYIRPAGGGLLTYLFLAQRSLDKIMQLVREEMNAVGGQQIHLPQLTPSTETRIVASIARGELRSYRQLPQVWYHFFTRLNDDPQRRQSRESATYSFAIGSGCTREAFLRILDRCELKCVVAATPQRQQFVVVCDAGDDQVLYCHACGYAADPEQASAHATPPATPDPEGDYEPEIFHTPSRKTIADVAEFTGLPESSQMKSLVLVVDGRPVLAMLRGDHSLSEAKLLTALKVKEFRPAHPDEIQRWFGAEAGSLGPVGVRDVRIIADEALKGRRNMIAGANRDDHHLRNVTPGEDFSTEYFDLRSARSGDPCRICERPLEIKSGIEVGQASTLTDSGVQVLNDAGEQAPVRMDVYRMGLERILCSVIELHHDQDGMTLPVSIAPFQVVVTPVNSGDANQRAAAERIYADCLEAGLDALLDDRDERPGVKFKDADIVGIPYRIVVGKKLSHGIVEIIERRAKKSEDVPQDSAASHVAARIHP